MLIEHAVRFAELLMQDTHVSDSQRHQMHQVSTNATILGVSATLCRVDVVLDSAKQKSEEAISVNQATLHGLY